MAPKASSKPPLERDQLIRAHRTMKTIRVFEERMIREFEIGNIPGFIHTYDGQEAVGTAVCMHLSDKDLIGSTHRGHGHCIAKGCDVGAMVKELMGRTTGLCRGKGGSMHIADISKGMLGANGIVGGAPPLAVGAALAAKTLRNGCVSVAFTGDGASNEGTVFESLNLAVVLKLPVIFLFENNGYGEATGVSYAVGSKDIAGRAAAFGMPAYTVDGTDFFAMHQVAGEVIARARAGEGPMAIEAKTTRFHGHFIGDPQLYRSKEELAMVRQDMDCLKIFTRRVIDHKWLTTAELEAVDQDVDALIERSVAEGLVAPKPALSELYTDVYNTY